MENETVQETKKGSNPLMMGLIVVVIVGVLAVGAFAMNSPKKDSAAEPTPAPTQAAMEVSPTSTETVSGKYKDGTYSQVGEYTSPGGAEELGVTVTLKDNIISEVEVEPKAERPISKKMQADFAEHYKEQVLGKSINEVSLGKISGSSLTPKGFNDALEKIKDEAKEA